MTRAPAEADTIPSESAPPANLPVAHALPHLQAAAATKREPLLWILLCLTGPILAENLLHLLVGFTDTWLAGHLREGPKQATAAVGSVAYILWLVNLLASAIAAGATAIVARAIGAKHKRLASSVCGQSIGAAAIM